MNLPVVRFCAEEVARQRRGPIQVWWMYEAWNSAQQAYSFEGHDRSNEGPIFWLGAVQHWGHLIEREKNAPVVRGVEYVPEWRSCGVRIGTRICPPPQEVPALMERWYLNLREMTPNEAYLEFEHIHPFEDGNGRTGKIIFNWLNRTLHDPVLPKVPAEWAIP